LTLRGFARMLPVLNLHRSILVLGLTAFCVFSVGCRPPVQGVYQGYVEGEYVYVASPAGGELVELWVRRGDAVTNGQALFLLEEEPEKAGVKSAQARLAQAEADLADRQKGLRPSELEALEAELRRLENEMELARLSLQRRESANTGQSGAVPEETLDRGRTRVAVLEAQKAKVRAVLKTGQLGSREDEIRMAADVAESRRAELAQAEWLLGQKRQASIVAAAVHDTLYREGEYVAPGRPVVALLPPGNILVRFFVPEPELAALRVGLGVKVSWDGAGEVQDATIRYVSTRAEYTPPVIYSQEARAKLVYLVEAFFERMDPTVVKVGQPVDVRITAPEHE